MLEVDDIMGFYLFDAAVLLMRAVLDELPETLTLVLINNGDSSFLGLLYAWTVLDVLPALITLR